MDDVCVLGGLHESTVYELNGRGDYVCIWCSTILGATVRSKYLEIETC
jgi:hypothetical protein